MLTWTPGDLESFRLWLKKTAAVEGDGYRKSFLVRRLAPRIRAAGFTEMAPYLEFLRRNPAEGEAVISKLLVHTSEFFRNPEVFASLGRILSVRARLLGWDPVKVVSAPCSRGEEAVSLAILMMENGLNGSILALDRSLSALRGLREGRFQLRSVASKMDNGRRARYFREVGERSSVAPRVLDRICPACCDLLAVFPVRGAHVVMVRNLFIYLTEEAQTSILDRVAISLAPGGLLVLGRAETMVAARNGAWRAVDRSSRIYEPSEGRMGGAA